MVSVCCLLGGPPLSHVVSHSCNDTSYIGDFCNISMKLCDVLKPCRNSGNCTNDPNILRSYSCMCKSGFDGTKCEYDIRLCASNTCLYNGMNLLNISMSYSK